ncbi:hypothetical protein LUZ63_001171 [Rhynchospora breviuscula]|uniref:3-deoxy-8-phosphooctulonate synthase n=1 Tax=Rhynchospora breviuscula TaxID=2022672 RepID=A0A9Q0CXA2_9POAL|nr:hypothetical protein LUZ63_001171 [Rhynchospora breviuscula]
MAGHIKSVATKLGLPLVFKSSFDISKPYFFKIISWSWYGRGLECQILEKVKMTHGLPVITDTDLLVAAADTGRIINIKKGQMCAASVMENSAERIMLAGNPNVMVCERGTMHGYNDLVFDPRNMEWLRDANCPVVAEITHSLQQPVGRNLEGGDVASGGLREMIPCIARTAVGAGADGIFYGGT